MPEALPCLAHFPGGFHGFGEERGFRGNSVEGGIKYVLHSDSSLGFTQRAVRGEYLERTLDPATLVTMVRRINPQSDFHALARFLETDVSE